MPEERRRQSPGRRDEDFFFQQFISRLERMEDRFEKALSRHDELWRDGVREVKRLVERIRDQLDKRVDDLEDAQKVERGKLEQRTDDKVAASESRVKLSQRIGFVGGGLGIVTVLYELSSRFLHLF